jgi:hypothetical protein
MVWPTLADGQDPTDPGDTSASYALRVVSAVPEYQDYLFQQW